MWSFWSLYLNNFCFILIIHRWYIFIATPKSVLLIHCFWALWVQTDNSVKASVHGVLSYKICSPCRALQNNTRWAEIFVFCDSCLVLIKHTFGSKSRLKKESKWMKDRYILFVKTSNTMSLVWMILSRSILLITYTSNYTQLDAFSDFSVLKTFRYEYFDRIWSTIDYIVKSLIIYYGIYWIDRVTSGIFVRSFNHRVKFYAVPMEKNILNVLMSRDLLQSTWNLDWVHEGWLVWICDHNVFTIIKNYYNYHNYY